MSFHFAVDRVTQFPVVKHDRQGFPGYIGLLPITKFQLEEYVACGQAQKDKPGDVEKFLMDVELMQLNTPGSPYAYPPCVEKLRRVPLSALTRDTRGSVVATNLDVGKFLVEAQNDFIPDQVQSLCPQTFGKFVVTWLQGELLPKDRLSKLHGLFEQSKTKDLLQEAMRTLGNQLSDRVLSLLMKLQDITPEEEKGLPLSHDLWEMTLYRQRISQTAGHGAGRTYYYFPIIIGTNRYYPIVNGTKDHLMLQAGSPLVGLRLLFQEKETT